MGNDGLPQEVVQFLIERIDSVSQLEALLLLRESAPRSWSATEIAARVYVEPAAAERFLQDLQRRGLIGGSRAGGYAFEAATGDAAVLELLAGCYRRQLVQIAQLIHSKASPAVREFARAFQVKKGE